MIKKRAWHPSVTTQFPVCTIPYHMDTYRGCPYNCVYCFARDFTTFARRNSEIKEFTYLEANNPDSSSSLGAGFSKEKYYKMQADRNMARHLYIRKMREVLSKERIAAKRDGTYALDLEFEIDPETYLLAE